MIPFTSCVCPAKKSLRPLQRPSEDSKRGTTVQESEEDTTRLQLKEPCDSLSRHPTYHWQEWYLSRQRFQGPVITPLAGTHLLDNCYNEIAQALLRKCNSWSFNTFNLDISTRGRSLTFLLVHLFHEYGFINHFQLDVMRVWRCFNLMEASYHRHNPYHNSVHAADVTQAMHCFLQESKFHDNLTPLEAMGSIIAAVAHDLDHPGVTQTFLVATSNHLVDLYHNKSVLENHHWRTAVSCILESGIFSELKKELWSDLQKQIQSLILATDITRQKEFLSKFQGYLSAQTLDMKNPHYRHFALQIALKCSDLCNPCRPWIISQRWSYQVCQEFFKQGLFEQQLNIPVTEVFNCNKTNVPKIQTDFLQHVVIPLFETWNTFMQTKLSNHLLKNLYHNYKQWQKLMDIVPQSPEECSIAQISECKLDTEEIKSDILLINTDNYFKHPRAPRIQLKSSTTDEYHAFTNLLSLSSTKTTTPLRKICVEIEAKTMLSTVFPDDTHITSSGSGTLQHCSTTTTKANTSHCDDTANKSQNCSEGQRCCSRPPSSQRKDQQSIREHHEKTICCQPNSFLCIVVEALNENHRCVDVKDVTHCVNTTQKIYPPTKTCKSFPLSSGNTNCSGSHNPYWGKSNSSKNSQGSTKNTTRFTIPSKLTASLCWHIKRSISAERSQLSFRNFDIPLPTRKGCKACNKISHRRGSAPAHITSHRNNSAASDLSLGTSWTDSWNRGKFSEAESCSTARRWSMPMEPTPS